MRVVQLKDEITADSKTSHQGLTNAEIEEMSVLTKTTEDMFVLQDLRGENGSADEFGNRC